MTETTSPDRSLGSSAGPTRTARRSRAAVVAVGVAGLALLFAVAPAEATPDDQTVQYVVQRNGDDIGTHRVRFQRQGARLVLEHTIRIRVTVLSYEAYRYDMTTRETWEGDRFLGMQSSSDRNGAASRIFVRAGASGVAIRRADGNRVSGPSGAIPADPHWNVLQPGVIHMIEAEDGSIRRVTVAGPTADHVSVRGQRVATQRYHVRGEHDATLWYDETGVLLRKQLVASDGSTVVTTRR